jgi:hypothetical protein
MKDWYAKTRAVTAKLKEAFERVEDDPREVEKLAAQHPSVKVLFDAAVRELESALAGEVRAAAKAAARHDAKATPESEAEARAALRAVNDKTGRAIKLYEAYDREYERAARSPSPAPRLTATKSRSARRKTAKVR